MALVGVPTPVKDDCDVVGASGAPLLPSGDGNGAPFAGPSPFTLGLTEAVLNLRPSSPVRPPPPLDVTVPLRPNPPARPPATAGPPRLEPGGTKAAPRVVGELGVDEWRDGREGEEARAEAGL